MNQRRVVCAATIVDGVTLIGARHYDSWMHDQYHSRGCKTGEDGDQQGFIDQFEKFMTRTEAWQVAEAAGQILHRCGGDTRDGGTLFSENLY